MFNTPKQPQGKELRPRYPNPHEMMWNNELYGKFLNAWTRIDPSSYQRSIPKGKMENQELHLIITTLYDSNLGLYKRIMEETNKSIGWK